MIPVTKTFLPEFEEYLPYLKEMWERRWITNHGPLSQKLIENLKTFLGVRHLFFVSNGTIALQLAIRALNLTKDIITTPFSYVASTASICWENCNPCFVDINKDTLCLDVERIENLITENTQAILGVHVYGNCCEVEKISKIAKKYSLKVIYDGAHAFASRLNGHSVLNFGDISTISFHATKLFHTAEGGAVITNNDELADKISYLMNFGHNGPEAFFGLGINGKNSELHAAMGLAVLPHIPRLIAARKEISYLYDHLLHRFIGISLQRPMLHPELEYNYSYYPLLFETEDVLLRVKSSLNEIHIMPRRYFSPSLSQLNYVRPQNAMIAEDVAKRVLCLPLYHDLEHDSVFRIAEIVNKYVSTS